MIDPAGTGTNGKVVVITGGSRGIGQGLAREFGTRGCRVVICGRSLATVETALLDLHARGVTATGIAADVADRDQVQALWNHAIATYGRVDVWINNAGMSVSRGPLPQVPADAVEAIVRTNLLGVMHGCAVAQTGLASQSGGGWIWNMEGFGSNGQKQPGLTSYGATKRAVTYLTESLIKETKGTPVKVAFLSPGIVATDLLVDDYDGQPEALERARKIFNILGDRVETVTPWLADKVLAAVEKGKPGVRVAWLTTPKAFGRFATAGFKKRDIFADTDLVSTGATGPTH
jgi:NAD(P)-dependent dehydrogenase (short-subunit alcohol dehydrogenase family)